MFEKEINCPILDPAMTVDWVDTTKAKVWVFTLVKIRWDISWPIYADTAMPELEWTIWDDQHAVFVFGVKYDEDGNNEFIVKKSINKSKTSKFSVWEIPKLSPDYAILWTVLVINETGWDFIWWTTDLVASWVTTIFVDNFGFVGY